MKAVLGIIGGLLYWFSPGFRNTIDTYFQTVRDWVQAVWDNTKVALIKITWLSIYLLIATAVLILMAIGFKSETLGLIALVPFGVWCFVLLNIINTITKATTAIHLAAGKVVGEVLRPLATLVMALGSIVLCLYCWPGLLGTIAWIVIALVLIIGAAGIYFGTQTHLFQKVMVGFVIATIILYPIGQYRDHTRLGAAINSWLLEANKGLALSFNLKESKQFVGNYKTDKEVGMVKEMDHQISYDPWTIKGWEPLILDGNGSKTGEDLDHKWVRVFEPGTEIPKPVREQFAAKGVESVVKIYYPPLDKTFFVPADIVLNGAEDNATATSQPTGPVSYTVAEGDNTWQIPADGQTHPLTGFNVPADKEYIDTLSVPVNTHLQWFYQTGGKWEPLTGELIYDRPGLRPWIKAAPGSEGTPVGLKLW